jgi:hypothetical protein
MNRRMLRLAAVALAFGAAVWPTGCAPGEIGTEAEACISWIYLETPADAVEQSDAVVRARIIDEAGTRPYEVLTSTTFTVEVDEWIKGSGESEIVVASLPRSCGDTGDSMADAAGGEPVVLFLRSTPEGWETLTPFQGVVAPGPDGGVPEEWPEP